MRFTYLFVLSLIHLVPKKGTVCYKFNSEPNRARQHLGVIHYESYKSVIHIPRGIVSFCDVGFKKVEKLEISGDLGRSIFLSLSFPSRLYNCTFIIFGIFLWFEKKCWQFSASITFWMSNFHLIVFPHIWCSSSNSSGIFNLPNISTPLWLLRWQVSKLPNTNEKISCII